MAAPTTTSPLGSRTVPFSRATLAPTCANTGLTKMATRAKARAARRAVRPLIRSPLFGLAESICWETHTQRKSGEQVYRYGGMVVKPLINWLCEYRLTFQLFPRNEIWAAFPGAHCPHTAEKFNAPLPSAPSACLGGDVPSRAKRALPRKWPRCPQRTSTGVWPARDAPPALPRQSE